MISITNTFSNDDINKFILLLRKSAYPYESMNEWETFNESLLQLKGELYSNLNMEILQMQITRIQKEFVKNSCRLHTCKKNS